MTAPDYDVIVRLGISVRCWRCSVVLPKHSDARLTRYGFEHVADCEPSA